MASVDVHGKCKGGTKAKSSLRHNDKEERMKPSVQHSNPHLDKSKRSLIRVTTDVVTKKFAICTIKELWNWMQRRIQTRGATELQCSV